MWIREPFKIRKQQRKSRFVEGDEEFTSKHVKFDISLIHLNGNLKWAIGSVAVKLRGAF